MRGNHYPMPGPSPMVMSLRLSVGIGVGDRLSLDPVSSEWRSPRHPLVIANAGQSCRASLRPIIYTLDGAWCGPSSWIDSGPFSQPKSGDLHCSISVPIYFLLAFMIFADTLTSSDVCVSRYVSNFNSGNRPRQNQVQP